MNNFIFWIGGLCLFHTIESFLHFHFQKRNIALSDFYLDVRYLLFLMIGILEYFFVKRLVYGTFSRYVGWSFFLFGAVVRLVSITQLKDQFKLIVRLRADQKVMQSGLYSIVRHPGYTGFWFVVVGSQLLLGNLYCTFVGVALLKIYFDKRIRMEELLLMKCSGYAEYKKNVKFTGIPFVHNC